MNHKYFIVIFTMIWFLSPIPSYSQDDPCLEGNDLLARTYCLVKEIKKSILVLQANHQTKINDLEVRTTNQEWQMRGVWSVISLGGIMGWFFIRRELKKLNGNNGRKINTLEWENFKKGKNAK